MSCPGELKISSMLSSELFFCAIISTFFAQLRGKDGSFRNFDKIESFIQPTFENPGHVKLGQQEHNGLGKLLFAVQ